MVSLRFSELAVHSFYPESQSQTCQLPFRPAASQRDSAGAECIESSCGSSFLQAKYLQISLNMSKQWSPDSTPSGTLPPFEVAKAFAFDAVLSQIESHTGKTCRQLLGQDKRDFIARHLTLKDGGSPGRTAVLVAIRKCKEGWYPGKEDGKRTGRPPVFAAHQKTAIARVAMATKRQLVTPTPAKVRAKLPRLCLNPETKTLASNWTIYRIFHTMCFDEVEDDPWVYLRSPTKDYVTDDMRKSRVVFAQHVLDQLPAACWWSHVAIDPCITILASTAAQSADQKIAAMGTLKMMSPKSRFKGVNLRAPATARTQGREEDKIHWTPIFARGKVRIYVCDPDAAHGNADLPARLNNGTDLAKFVRNVLPRLLEEMQQQHRWLRTPRTVVHDKASYFVAPRSQRLARPFADALRSGGMKSWLGDADADCSWLAGRLGDVYPHETVISHIRHGLDHRFPRTMHGETRAQFARRMALVETHLNSPEFKAASGGGLASLAQGLHSRCSRMVELQGGRLRT